MEMQISRPTTAQMVLEIRQTLFLPENHPLLTLVDQSFATFVVQGTVSASSNGPSLYHLDLQVLLDMLEGDALVSSLMSNRADSPILDKVVDPNPYTIELMFCLVLKRVTCCSINIVSAT